MSATVCWAEHPTATYTVGGLGIKPYRCMSLTGHQGKHWAPNVATAVDVVWDNWLTLAEAGRRYDIPQPTLRWHCRRGALEQVCRKEGKNYEVTDDDVRALAKLLKQRRDALHEMRKNR